MKREMQHVYYISYGIQNLKRDVKYKIQNLKFEMKNMSH